MNQKAGNSRRNLVIGILAVAAAAVLCAVAYRVFVRDGGGGPAEKSDVAEERVVADFYTSLAALDVEQNQLAAELLSKTVESEPREPALWANLAVAHLRLRDTESARQTLQEAIERAGEVPELMLLRAEVLEHAGETEAAIEQLRRVHQVRPENIAATYSLAKLLGQVRSGETEARRLSLLADILSRAPGNLRARCEQARLAATLERPDELRKALERLLAESEQWREAAQEQLKQADEAARAGDFRRAARSLTFFENLVKPGPQYQQSLAQLGATSLGMVGTPVRSFLRLKLPPVEAAEPDVELAFEVQELSETAARPDLVLAVEQPGERSSTLVSLSDDTLIAGESAALPFSGSSTGTTPASLSVADLNYDFQPDLICAGSEGCRIYLGQPDGSFLPHKADLEEFDQPWRSVWSVDVEADGDLDLLLSDGRSPLRWIRNNGDMTFTAMSEFIPAERVIDLQAADFDGDGDLDLATLDASGTVAVWENRRTGSFVAAPAPVDGPRLALAVGDVNRDGQMDLVSLSASGELRFAAWTADGDSSESPLTTWAPSGSLEDAAPGEVFLAIADVDNNGAVDIVAGLGYETGILLRTAGGDWLPLPGTPAMRVTSVADVNNDGLLDLVGLSETAGLTAINRSRAGYGWHVIQPTAATAVGDQRINPFGIGGRIEIRAGNLVQTAAIRSPRVHFGLGNHNRADVARIVWPNGTVQAEFDLQAGQKVTAQQRLKGSCPWIFAFDGEEFRFIKDFIWRSPLGLRINAQTTAGVVQTEDWIKIPGGQLAAVDGRYRVRITAELWETHFFDQVALLAVDHPAEVEVFVDERFVPSTRPAQKVIAATPPEPLHKPDDHRGKPLDGVLRSIDGVYADTFALGKYQGVAEEHWIEFELPHEVSSERHVLLMGHGWIYPTDSSLNVALGQGSAPKPFGLILEQQDPSGAWRVVRDNLGFPAGKNKDVVIELPAGLLDISRRFRLRTNMEIYWDALGWSYAVPDAEPQVSRLPVEAAELRHRGFSRLKPLDRRRPDTPVYEVIAGGQRWLDLEGYYTRFGDVRELLAAVDDRYVIMNAGDELVFEFDAGKGPPPGWKRDFVLVGDGWVKDGDFNTAFSRWVRPLPAHGDDDYSGPLLPLEEDPVYRRHADDWRDYHTRYVTPRRFRQGLRQPAVTADSIHGENPQ